MNEYCLQQSKIILIVAKCDLLVVCFPARVIIATVPSFCCLFYDGHLLLLHASLLLMVQWMLPHFCCCHHNSLLLPSSSSTNISADVHRCCREPCFFCHLLLQLSFINNVIYCRALWSIAAYCCCLRLQTMVKYQLYDVHRLLLLFLLLAYCWRIVAHSLCIIELPWLLLLNRSLMLCVRISVARSCCTCSLTAVVRHLLLLALFATAEAHYSPQSLLNPKSSVCSHTHTYETQTHTHCLPHVIFILHAHTLIIPTTHSHNYNNCSCEVTH